MKKELNKIKNYFKMYKKQILLLFGIAIITYMIKFFNYNLSIDSEVTVNDPSANDIPWICTGRWALTILGKFIHFGRKYNPFFSNLVMIIFLVFSVVVLSYLISKVIKKEKLEHVVLLTLGSIVLTSPVICEMLNFTMMAAEVAIGIFFVNIAVYTTYLAVYEKYKICYPISILLLTIAMGIYQAFFPLYISIVAFIYLLALIKNEDKLSVNIIKLIKIIAIFVTSYIFCSLITKLLLMHYGLKESGYLFNQITWGKIPIIDSIMNILSYMIEIVFPSISSSVWNYSYLLVILISLVYIGYLIKRKKLKSILPTLCILFLLLSPFLIAILTANAVAIRTMLNLPFIVGLFFILFIAAVEKKKYLQYSLYFLVVVTSIIQLKNSSDLFYSDYIRYQEDKMLIQSIFNKMDVTPNLPKNNRELVPVVFIGMHSSKSTGVMTKGDTMSYSFFEWDAGTEFASNKRIYGLARTLGYYYQAPTKIQIKKAQKRSEEMEVYPAKDSIKVMDDYVVVRMS